MPLIRLWLGCCIVFVLTVADSVSLHAQDFPARIPKVLYSCDTVGVLGCFPLMRSGDRSYVLGNVSKASFAGEQGEIAVEKFSAQELVIRYKDLDKEATFTGRVEGNRIYGNVRNNTSAGGKAVQLEGKWTALVVTDAMEFSEVASRLPKMMNVCQTNDDDRNLPKEDCFTWYWDATSPIFTGNQMTVQRFDADEVNILGMSQHGTTVLAAYTGKIEGNRIQGTVDYYSGDGHRWAGKWTASFASTAQN